MAIRILTDSSSDLSPEIIQGYNIDLLPLMVYIDDIEYEDGVGITSSEVAHAMQEGKSARTAQVPLLKFYEYFMQADEKDTIICMLISSGISGTYQTALQAVDMIKDERPEMDIRVLDNKTISLGCGLGVLDAAKKIKEGYSADNLEKYILEQSKYMRHLFTVPELKWLVEGGRVSKAAGMMGSLLDIKPLLHVEDGKLLVFDKARGKKNRFNKLMEYISCKCENMHGQTIAINHVINEKEAKKIAAYLQEHFQPERILIKELGPVITSHCGPGLISIYFRSDKPE